MIPTVLKEKQYIYPKVKDSALSFFKQLQRIAESIERRFGTLFFINIISKMYQDDKEKERLPLLPEQ